MGTVTAGIDPAVENRAPAGWKKARASRRPPLSLRVFRTVHLVLGLSLGLLLVAQGLSGAALVWRPELDRLMLGRLVSTSADGTGPLAAGALEREWAAAHAAAPAGKLRLVRLAAVPEGTDEWVLQMPAMAGQTARDGQSAGTGSRWTVYTSPRDAQVLGIRGMRRDTLQWLIELHHNLLLGKTGRLLQGYLAIGTVLLSLSGLWLWWPARWMPSRFRPQVAARPLHYALGFWAMGPLLAISLTATYWTWRQPLETLFGVAARDSGTNAAAPHQERSLADPAAPGASHERKGAPKPGGPLLLDAVRSAAQQAVPGARLTAIRPPDRQGFYTVQFAGAGEHFRASPNSAIVRVESDGSAHVSKLVLWSEQPRGRRLLEWLPRIHQAEFGGWPVRLIWCLTGLMPAVLYGSGFLMWRRRLRVPR